MPTNENLNKIDQLDLNHVRAYVAEKRGWTMDHAKSVEKDYRDFLKLYAQNPEGEYVSTRHVDDFWHAHILHVSKYIQDCMSSFGFVLDHLPVVEEGRDLTPYYNRYSQTQDTFSENFGRRMGDGNQSQDQAICYSDIKQAICYGRNPVSAICYGRGPVLNAA